MAAAAPQPGGLNMFELACMHGRLVVVCAMAKLRRDIVNVAQMRSRSGYTPAALAAKVCTALLVGSVCWHSTLTLLTDMRHA